MKIGILSDNHGILRENVLTILKDCDYIIHAGDIVTKSAYETLKSLQIPTYIVRGNCDCSHWTAYLPDTLSFSIDGQLFYLIHDSSKIPRGADSECRFVISGHTHRYSNYTRKGQVFLNPGSTSSDRGGTGCTMMLLHLEPDTYRIEQVLLSS